MLYVPAGGDPTYWHAAGTLLGVFESEFPVQQKQLRAGDKLILFSDGVHPPATGPGALHDPLVEAAKKHRHLAVQAFVDSVAPDGKANARRVTADCAWSVSARIDNSG